MVAPSASNMAGTTPIADPADIGTATSNLNGTMTGTEPDQRLTNGKIPDDNDSVFEAQIRAAAIAGTDPDTQKNLWNEYRRYKGLPEKE